MLAGRSYLYYGTSLPDDYLQRFERIDRLSFDGAVLDAKAARAVVATASQQPFGEQRLVVIQNADQLSVQIQNTFLKVLEEPPAFLVVVLSTIRPGALLPTVRSRLHSLTVSAARDEIGEAGQAPNEQSLRALVEKQKDRQSLTGVLETVRAEVKPLLFKEPSAEVTQTIELLDRSIHRLGQNANQKLVIDALLLNWPL